MVGTDSRRTARPLLTQRRAAWLRILAQGPAVAEHPAVAHWCRQLGWSEWDWRTPSGEAVSEGEAEVRFGPRWWEAVTCGRRERLTPAGSEVLARVSEDGGGLVEMRDVVARLRRLADFERFRAGHLTSGLALTGNLRDDAQANAAALDAAVAFIEERTDG